MINAYEAYEIMKKNLEENSYIVDMAECRNAYVFGIIEQGEEGKHCDISGYDKVDKRTGKVGFMHFFDYADEVEAETVKEIDILGFK